jgi:plastocyanin
LPAVPTLLAATDITAFHVLGACLALWAVILTAIGVTRPDFPGKGAGTKIVMGISAVLVVSTIAAAIGTAKSAPKAGEQAGNTQAAPPPKASAPPPKSPGTVNTLLLKADPTGQLRFDKNTLAAPAGNVRLTLQNPAPVPHNISIEGPGGISKQGPTVQQGGASQVQVTLKPGTYTYYCSVPGHRQAGMQGTLTVK